MRDKVEKVFQLFFLLLQKNVEYLPNECEMTMVMWGKVLKHQQYDMRNVCVSGIRELHLL